MVASAQLYPFHFARSGLVTRVDMLATPKTQVVEQIMVTGARIELAARALKGHRHDQKHSENREITRQFAAALLVCGDVWRWLVIGVGHNRRHTLDERNAADSRISNGNRFERHDRDTNR